MVTGRELLLVCVLCSVPALVAVSIPQSSSGSQEGIVECVTVDAGSYLRGSHYGSKDERPVRTVIISRSYFMSRYEISVADFRTFAEAAGYRTTAERQGWAWVYSGSEWVKSNGANWRNPSFTQEDDHPVVCVSWHDAVAYCNWLSEQERLTPAYSGFEEDTVCAFSADGYRLPTEAEWEYAARGGPSGLEYGYAGTDDAEDLSEYANFADKNSNLGWADRGQEDGFEYTSPVGTYKPNELGLYDMTGNVSEWVWDWYAVYPSMAQTDPSGPSSGLFRVQRGGSWFDDDYGLRTTYRVDKFPTDSLSRVGFRVVRTCP